MNRLLISCFIFLFACKQKQQPQDMVLQLRELSELATVEYTVSKIVRASDDQTWYKVGDRKILMSCRASVKAGLDLAELKPGDIQVEGKNIQITLPHARILSVRIRPEDIRTEYEEVGLFRSDFSAGERNSLMAQGEAQIRKQIEATNIQQAAESQASLALGNFYRGLGFEKVSITFNDRSKTPAGPAQ